MPTLDVSEILTDPEFVSDFVVQRRAETVNNFGISEQTITPINVSGVVTASPTNLVRDVDMQFAPNSILVHTRFRLRGPAPGYQPDVVVWQGNRYVVKALRDWSEFGVGYTAAECESIDAVDNPPQ